MLHLMIGNKVFGDSKIFKDSKHQQIYCSGIRVECPENKQVHRAAASVIFIEASYVVRPLLPDQNKVAIQFRAYHISDNHGLSARY